MTITYTDGTTQTAALGFSDWTLNGGSASGPSYGNSVAASTPYRNNTSGTSQNVTTDVFSASISLESGKTVQSITLPSSVNQGALHVFAIGTNKGALTG